MDPGLSRRSFLSLSGTSTAAMALGLRFDPGYGSLTHMEQQHASGKGLHADGRWRVSIGIRGGRNAPDLSTATTVPISFAVWQGEHHQRGSRKQYVDWTELVLRDGE